MSPLNFDGVSCLMESSKNAQTWRWLSKAKIWFLIFSVSTAHLWRTVWRKYKYANNQQSFIYQTILSRLTFFYIFLTNICDIVQSSLKLQIPFIFSKLCSIWIRLFFSRTRRLMPSILMEATSTQRGRVLVWYLPSGRATQVSAIHCHLCFIHFHILFYTKLLEYSTK